MSEDDSAKTRKKRAFKILRITLLGLAVICALLAIIVLSLPVLLSSDFTRARLTEQITKATGKPAKLDALSFGWGDGLRLRGLSIGQGELYDPAFLLRLDILHAHLDILAALRGDYRLVVTVRGLAAHVDAGSTEPKPPAKPLPDALRETFASLRDALATSVPGHDAHIDIDLADMDLRLEPPHGGRPLELRGIALHLAAPGLRAAPLTVHAELNVQVGKAPGTPVRLDLSLAKLMDASGRFCPVQAELFGKAQGSGFTLDLGGSLETTLKINLRTQLREALTPVRALSPALPEVDGAVALGLTLAKPAADKLNVGFVLFADGLRAAGGSLEAKAVGPLTLNLLQEAEFDLAGQTAHLPGSLELRPSSHIRWDAGLTGLAEGKPRLSVTLSPVHLALGEMLPALRAYLPPGLRLGAATLDAETIALTTDIPAPEKTPALEARVDGLAFAASRLAKTDATGTLTLEGAQLRVASALVRLPAQGAQGLVQAEISAAMDGLRLPGKTPVELSRFSLPRLGLRVEGFALNPAALFALTGNATLDMESQAKGMAIKGKAAIPAMDARLRLRAALPADKSASVQLDALELGAPVVRVVQQGKPALEVPLRLHSSAPNIRLSGAPLTPALSGLRFDLDLGAALNCAGQADLAGRDLRTEGRLRLDAAKLLALAAHLAPPKAKASGAVALDWKLAATLPASQPGTQPATQPGTKPTAAKAGKKLSQRLKELRDVREADVQLRLDALSLDWPLAAAVGKAETGRPAETLHLRGLSTPKPLRLVSKNGAEESTLSGSLAFGPMDSLPGAGKLAKPLRGLLTLNAAQQGARSVQLSQVLHLEGFELDQNLSLTLDKLDGVLDRDDDRLAAALEQMDGQASFSLVTGLQALPAKARSAESGRKTGAQALSGKGRLEAGAEVRLYGGKSLALSARLLSPGLNITMGPDLSVTGLTSDVRFTRRYELAPGLRCPGEPGVETTPLSEQVFSQSTGGTGAYPGGEALGQLLRTDSAGPSDGVFALSRLKMKAGGLPLDIHDVELRLDTSGPVPGLRAFRAGLLGGNVLGSAMLRKNAGRYSLNADMAFTGIDPSRFFPAKGRSIPASQSETSGRLSLSVPLTPDPEALLQRMNLRADITKIGPATLERMLYALDPEEKNETIVQQRRLMGIGYPRYLRIAAAYGNLSVTGAVEVKGFQLDLPPVDRLAIANLPLRQQLARPLASLPALIKALDAASGTRICRNPADAKGALRVVEPAATKGATE